MLEKDRKLRYQSTADIRTDLQRLKRDSDWGRAASATTQGRAEVRGEIHLGSMDGGDCCDNCSYRTRRGRLVGLLAQGARVDRQRHHCLL